MVFVLFYETVLKYNEFEKGNVVFHMCLDLELEGNGKLDLRTKGRIIRDTVSKCYEVL